MIQKSYDLRNLGLFTFLGVSVITSAAEKPRKNILFLMSDDFNYWTKAQGYYPQAITPNLDKLAAKGVMFTNAHCASPVSNPSRNALWSGFRPSTTGVQGNEEGFVREKPGFANITTMNQYFKENGYWVYGAGKIYHYGMTGDKFKTDNVNFSDFYNDGIGCSGGTYLNWSASDATFKWSINADPMTESNCKDFKMVKSVANLISNYSTSANKDKPFFIAAGVFLPHLPWNVPKQFFDLFNTDDLDLPKGYKPGDLSDTDEGINSWFTDAVKAGKWKEAIHAYLGAIAMTDHNVGVMLDALENSPYKDNTIICFMGDHGWHLGEKERFGKATYWDAASRTTLIIYDPSAQGNGKFSAQTVSLQDLYPTLVELSGVPIKTDIEGNSIAHLLDNPLDLRWDKPIIGSRVGIDYIITNKWHYVNDPNTNKRMLYDRVNDPYEFNNLYKIPQYAPVLQTLNEQLDSVINIGTSMRTKLLANYSFVPKIHTIPGIIQAEDYDEGGYTQTYFVANKVTTGTQYRTGDGTNIKITDDSNGSYHIASLAAGDWTTYTVKDFLTGQYNVDFRVKNSGTTPAVLQIFNRSALLSEVSVPSGISTWQTIRAPQISLDEQTSTRLKIIVKSGTNVLFNSMAFEMKITNNKQITANNSRKCIVNTTVTDNILYLDLLKTGFTPTLSIYDMKGKLMLNKVVPGEQNIAFNLPAHIVKGVYFLRVADGNVSSVEKFIVK